METFNRILYKVIMTDGKGYLEGSYTDLYVKRFIKAYARNSPLKGLKEYYKKEITGEFATSDPTYIKDTEQTPIETELVKV